MVKMAAAWCYCHVTATHHVERYQVCGGVMALAMLQRSRNPVTSKVGVLWV